MSTIKPKYLFVNKAGRVLLICSNFRITAAVMGQLIFIIEASRTLTLLLGRFHYPLRIIIVGPH